MRYLLALLLLVGSLCTFGCSKANPKEDSTSAPSAESVATKETAKSESSSKQESPPKVKPEKGPADPGTPQVIAEGVGATGDEALKDAFRNAVRQVVGAVVDAETLVKNDEIISDKVLTYSDGFVKTYEEISKKQDKGLFRTKIKATVERRSVIAKLQAANITVKDVDGKGIFAEVVTQLHAEKNAKELVEKALEGFPLNVLQAEVVGKPEVVERKDAGVTILLRVNLRADRKAYAAWTPKIQKTLQAVAKNKGNFSLVAEDVTRAYQHMAGWGFNDGNKLMAVMKGYSDPNGVSSGLLTWKSKMPAMFVNFPANQNDSGKKGHIAIALNTHQSSDSLRTEWEYYVVDGGDRRFGQ